VNVSARSPLILGASFALLSALAFGATTPLIARFGAATGPFATAALLYAGAALVGWCAVGRGPREGRPTRAVVARVALSALVGAMLAPAALVWGIRQTGGLSASLALSFESVFTVAIAVAILHEHVGGRIALAVGLTAAGGVALALGAPPGSLALAGLASVLAATLLWAVDNALTGSVADADPATVLAAKTTLGAAGSALVAVALREPLPSAAAALGLLTVGTIGYGVSLRWYLAAQRLFGIARTASVFASAPLVGAVIALGIGEGRLTLPIVAASVLMALGVWLHVTEKHAHTHTHQELEHEHAHTHDEHHAHAHVAPVPGTHTHAHRHAALVHTHPHAPDAHHAHAHERDAAMHDHERGTTPFERLALLVFFVIAVLGCIAVFTFGLHPERFHHR
jgi:drug/metabolite transporter (DMT)-like permease